MEGSGPNFAGPRARFCRVLGRPSCSRMASKPPNSLQNAIENSSFWQTTLEMPSKSTFPKNLYFSKFSIDCFIFLDLGFLENSFAFPQKAWPESGGGGAHHGGLQWNNCFSVHPGSSIMPYFGHFLHVGRLDNRLASEWPRRDARSVNNFPKTSKRFQRHRNASTRIRTHPNRSE